MPEKERERDREREREGERWVSAWQKMNKGVLTLMFEPSRSDLKASWWTVGCCMARIGGQRGPYCDV
jgi:hypothetical protein